MNKNQAMSHIYANPGDKARKKFWEPHNYIFVNDKGIVVDQDRYTNNPNNETEGNDDWEIIKAPIRIETTIWLSGDPAPEHKGHNLRDFLIGANTELEHHQTTACPHEFKITIEEVSK